ncbi:carboxypeptidase regulatory-like domain-containing protein, partial [Citrobacter sp. AAK_AS5]
MTDAVSGKAVPGARVVLAEAGTKGVIAEMAADASGGAAFANARLGLLNWDDGKGRLPIARRAVTLTASADGYESRV